MTAGSVVWRRSSELALVESADRVVLVHLAHPERPARILAGSAAAVWHAIDGEHSTDTVVSTVADSYGVSPVDVGGDVTQLLDRLAAEGLIEERQP